MRLPSIGPILLLLLVACGGGERKTRCGIAALAGPGMLLEEFTRPGHTLGSAPEKMPEVLAVRFAAAEAFRGLVGRTDSGWVVGIEGTLPAKSRPGFGVLVVDPVLGPRGVVVYEGPPIPGAPVLGRVNLGATEVPLIGLRAAPAAFEEPTCPLFPDSLGK
jgi:hypothetical protein